MNTITRIFIVLIIAAPLLAEEIHRTGNWYGQCALSHGRSLRGHDR